jgi:hypothetical protein
MPTAIKDGDTVYVLDPVNIRWMEYDENRNDLTIYYINDKMETIRHRNIQKVYNDFLLTLNVLDLDSTDYCNVTRR